MKIPKKYIGRGDVIYDIIQEKKIPTATAETLDGLLDYDNQLMFIRSGLSQQRKEQTFLHEMFHDVTWPFEVYDLKKEEYVCLLESDLYAVLRRNKCNFAE